MYNTPVYLQVFFIFGTFDNIIIIGKKTNKNLKTNKMNIKKIIKWHI